jgi:hypothetical protein
VIVELNRGIIDCYELLIEIVLTIVGTMCLSLISLSPWRYAFTHRKLSRNHNTDVILNVDDCWEFLLVTRYSIGRFVKYYFKRLLNVLLIGHWYYRQ